MAKSEKIEKESGSKDLILATEIQPEVLFANDNKKLEVLLSNIEKEVISIVPDITTAKGRKEITVNVSRVTKTKTLLDKVGKEYNAKQKELLKVFDSRRKHAFTFLEDLQKEVRKPLTEWEDKEKDRIAKCEGIINTFIEAGKNSENWMSHTREELSDLLNTIIEITITKRLAEFEEEARLAKVDAIEKINNAISNRSKYDDEQSELKKLREKVAKDDKIRFESDQRSKAEREAKEEIIRANAAQKLAEQRVAQAEKQRVIDAEEAEKQKQIAVEESAKKERNRIEAEKQKEIEEEKKRAANKTHKGKINRTIVKELLKCGINDVQAKKVVTVIAQNKVPNVKISY